MYPWSKLKDKVKRLSRLIGMGVLIFGLMDVGYFPLQVMAQAGDPRTAEAHLLDSNDQGILIEFTAPEYKLQSEIIQGIYYQSVNVTGASLANEKDQPQIPVINTLVGIPAHTNYKLEIVTDKAATLPGHFLLPPSLQAKPIQSEFLPGETEPTILRTKEGLQPLSSAQLVYPSLPVQLGNEAWFRDQRIVRVAFYPFQYDRQQGALIWHRSLRVQIHFLGAPATRNLPLSTWSDNYFEPVLRQGLLNYASARAWRSTSGNASEQALGTELLPYSRLNISNAGQQKYRIPIKADGLYRLTYDNLKVAGVPVDSLDVNKLQITNQGRLVAYYFDDINADLVFGSGDAIIFYGQKFRGDWMAKRYVNENINWLTYSTQMPDGSPSDWMPSMNAKMLEKYTDENVYWLKPGGLQANHMQDFASNEPGVMVSNITQNDNGSSVYLPLVSTEAGLASYQETVHVEQSHYWKTTLFAGEDTWYWDEIKTSSSASRTYIAPLTGPLPKDAIATLSGELVAAAYNDDASPDHHIQIFVNDPQHLEPVLDATWDGKSRFHFEANVNQSQLVEGDNQIDLVVFKTPNLSIEDLYLDWFQIDYNRHYQARNNRIDFSSETGFQSYRITGFTAAEVGVYDITDPISPVRITNFSYNNGIVRFWANQAASEQYYVGVSEVVPSQDISVYTPTDLTQPVDYIFITHREFLASIQTLANYRETQGLSTLVVNIDDLYNEFNDGIYNPIAIKNFLAYTFQNWSKPPSYVLLVGDGHWNFKGYPDYDSPPIFMPPFLSWVDPWQGEVDSANLLAAVVGDDPLPDLSIGRLPVNSVQELDNVISKTITFEQNAPQAWQKNLLFIADNTPDPAGDFVAASEQIIANYVPLDYTSDRVYLDSFTDTNTCNSPPPPAQQTCPAATKAIVDDLNQKGAFLVNYEGHASLNFWANEKIFAGQDIANLNNGGMLPVVLSMTCLDGYWIHPNLIVTSKAGPGLAEELLRAQQRGAVATFSPTGLGVATGHGSLQEGFYEAVFRYGASRLGNAAMSAKLSLYATGYNLDLLHTFTIFGDPALRFPGLKSAFLPLVGKHS
jgi:hypothetical protein